MNELQTKWLDSRGGRTWADVHYDNEGGYVWMTSPSGPVKEYIPTEYDLTEITMLP